MHVASSYLYCVAPNDMRQLVCHCRYVTQPKKILACPRRPRLQKPQACRNLLLETLTRYARIHRADCFVRFLRQSEPPTAACVWNVRISRPGLPIQASDWVFLHQLETVATAFAGTTSRPSLRSTAPDVPLAGITSANSMAQSPLPRLMPATSFQDQASEFLSLET